MKDLEETILSVKSSSKKAVGVPSYSKNYVFAAVYRDTIRPPVQGQAPEMTSFQIFMQSTLATKHVFLRLPFTKLCQSAACFGTKFQNNAHCNVLLPVLEQKILV